MERPDFVERALKALTNGDEMVASPLPRFPANLPSDRVGEIHDRVVGRAGEQARADMERARHDIERLHRRSPSTPD
ncbi:hypothetical protein [Streptomyces dysideae]|uniref:Uncharacterized protein n=1 Tax=Streptomyces dysideae TaxID=909626 RepID=A0A101UPB0_9ACTN|nr:hypothetical protein [Streptomyces dysideae]KUO14322.1 hypothetical protein AQJ91_47550 [Streptomyces dysideae]